MKIALGQIKVIPGQPEKNFQKIEDYINKALDQQCSIVAFPEMV